MFGRYRSALLALVIACFVASRVNCSELTSRSLLQATPTAEDPVYQQVAVVSDASCAIASSQVYCWGNIPNGVRKKAPKLMPWTGKFTSVAMEGTMIYLLSENGKLQSVDRNDPQLTVTEVPGNPLKSISVGRDHICGVTSQDRAVCKGKNSYGQLGNGSNTDSDNDWIPVTTASGGSWVEISTGDFFTCGVLKVDDVQKGMCWGNNSSGQLGVNSTATAVPSVNTPTKVKVVNSKGEEDTAIQWISLSAGSIIGDSANGVNAGACGLTSEKTLYCWGANRQGQAGTGGTEAKYNSPQKIQGPAAQYNSVVVGASYACAVGADSRGYCWGENGTGRLGTGSNDSVNKPTVLAGGKPGYTSVVAGGGRHSCGLDGTNIFCFGSNGAGQLGDGTTEASNTPKKTSSAAILPPPPPPEPKPKPPKKDDDDDDDKSPSGEDGTDDDGGEFVDPPIVPTEPDYGDYDYIPPTQAPGDYGDYDYIPAPPSFVDYSTPSFDYTLPTGGDYPSYNPPAYIPTGGGDYSAGDDYGPAAEYDYNVDYADYADAPAPAPMQVADDFSLKLAPAPAPVPAPLPMPAQLPMTAVADTLKAAGGAVSITSSLVAALVLALAMF